MDSKICGVSDSNTLNYLINHPYPPQFIGFICNYKKSPRYVNFDSLKNLIKIKKRNIKFVSVLVKPDPQILEKMGIEKVDGFLFDLGISSHQVDSEHRGFSYMKDSPLDMRFNNGDDNQLTAKDIINTINLERLVFAFKEYTNLKNPRFIARKLIEYRKTKKKTTSRSVTSEFLH